MKVKSIEKTDGYNLEFIEKQAKIIMEREGEHHPLAILSSEKEIFLFPMKFNGDKEKEVTQEILRKFVQAKKIESYWLIMESWVSCNPHVTKASRDINRKEALVISEFSVNDMNGRMLTILFERDGKKIIWNERVLLDNESNKGGFHSAWNFYKEDISDEMAELKEKTRIEDIVRRVEKSDMSHEIKMLRKMWKRDKGTDLESTDDEIKKQFIKAIRKGKIGFANAIIPDKFKMDTDNVDLSQLLKKEREKENVSDM